ncbi:hypothetical protein ACFQJD_05080 [Haloplanus sp. GCM10025708]|uniref:hypothetical protein n=1 Tax=Haloplanus sp. GCM10025708 TaxID=3252679 RepID=UPI0036122031
MYDDDLEAIEERFNETLPDQQCLTRDGLEDVIRWKLNGQKGRRDRNIEKVNTVPDEFIQRVSEAAFLVDDPKIQLKTLRSIPGSVERRPQSYFPSTIPKPTPSVIGIWFTSYSAKIGSCESRTIRRSLPNCVTGIRGFRSPNRRESLLPTVSRRKRRGGVILFRLAAARSPSSCRRSS